MVASGTLIDGMHEVTEEMVIRCVPEEVVFEPVTQEVQIDLFALGVEKTVLAYRHRLISMGVWGATISDLESEVTQEILR